jgi:hypothetical protein
LSRRQALASASQKPRYKTRNEPLLGRPVDEMVDKSGTRDIDIMDTQ